MGPGRTVQLHFDNGRCEEVLAVDIWCMLNVMIIIINISYDKQQNDSNDWP